MKEAQTQIVPRAGLSKDTTMEKTVALLTDFSEVSDEAFVHALALALAYKHDLYLLHVKTPGREPVWSSFPQVRKTLARRGVIDADAAESEVETKLGITLRRQHHMPCRMLLTAAGEGRSDFPRETGGVMTSRKK